MAGVGPEINGEARYPVSNFTCWYPYHVNLSTPFTPSIWEQNPHAPPPKIGSPILKLLFKEMKDMIDEGGVNSSPLKGQFSADVTDLGAVSYILKTLQTLLVVAEEDHNTLINELCTFYLDNNNHFHKVAWLRMVGQFVNKDFYNRFILDSETTKTFHKFHRARQILKTTIDNFLPLIQEWSALYRNGEALQELNLIHVLLKDFRKKAFKWSLIAQATRVELNLKKRPYSPNTIKKKQMTMLNSAQELAKIANIVKTEETQPMELEAASEIVPLSSVSINSEATISERDSPIMTNTEATISERDSPITTNSEATISEPISPITTHSDTSFRNSFSSDSSYLSADLHKLSLA